MTTPTTPARPFTGLLHELDQLLQSAERAERYLASTPLPVASDVYSDLSHACDRARQAVADALAGPAPKAGDVAPPVTHAMVQTLGVLLAQKQGVYLSSKTVGEYLAAALAAPAAATEREK